MVKKILSYSYIYILLLLMYVPILVLIVFSFTNATYIGTWNGFSFDLYVALFESEEIMIAVGNTLIIAVISAVCSTILGTLGAVGGHYLKRKSKAALENINQIPVVNAEIVMALSLVVMFVFIGNMIFGGANLFSFWTLLAGHIVISAPFVYLNVKPKLQQMDPSLYEAALDLGCAPRKALYKVVVPQILPGIFSGFISINASGDGIDAKGEVSVSDGTIMISTADNEEDMVIDYSDDLYITGGTILATGNLSGEKNFSETEQQIITLNLDSQPQNTFIEILDQSGNLIFSDIAEQPFSNIIVSSSLLQKGYTYTLKIGSYATTITI